MLLITVYIVILIIFVIFHRAHNTICTAEWAQAILENETGKRKQMIYVLAGNNEEFYLVIKSMNNPKLYS